MHTLTSGRVHTAWAVPKNKREFHIAAQGCYGNATCSVCKGPDMPIGYNGSWKDGDSKGKRSLKSLLPLFPLFVQLASLLKCCPKESWVITLAVKRHKVQPFHCVRVAFEVSWDAETSLYHSILFYPEGWAAIHPRTTTPTPPFHSSHSLPRWRAKTGKAKNRLFTWEGREKNTWSQKIATAAPSIYYL